MRWLPAMLCTFVVATASARAQIVDLPADVFRGAGLSDPAIGAAPPSALPDNPFAPAFGAPTAPLPPLPYVGDPFLAPRSPYYSAQLPGSRGPTMVSPDDDAPTSHSHAGHDHAGHNHGGSSHAGHSHAGEGPLTGHAHSGDHHGFDHIGPYEQHNRGVFEAYGHAGHTSIEGYPFVHGIRTEIDFVERALEWDLRPTYGADGDTVDELEFDSELVWALNSRMILIVGAPLASINPYDGPSTTGIGDTEVGLQFLAYGGESSLFFTALNFSVPTGDSDRDLGDGHLKVEPRALWLYDFRQGTYFQSVFSWETPVSTTGEPSEFHYEMALFHTILATRDWRVFRFFTPIIELNGLTQLTEEGHGRTVLDVTGGVRWVVRGANEIGLGASYPMAGRRDFDELVIMSYRLHF